MTSLDQATAIAGLGADFIGINFCPRSKRYLPPHPGLAAWKRALAGHAQIVGVFANPSLDHPMISREILDAVQLHGDENPDFCARLRERGWRVIKALRVRDETSLACVAPFPVDDVLLDALRPGELGGTGEAFPWTLAERFRALHPDRNLWLAGGLTPDNVADAVRDIHPFAVDVASGVEDAVPGVKNMSKVTAFIRRARSQP